MSLQSILSFTIRYFQKNSKKRLLDAFMILRNQYVLLDNKYKEQEEEIARLKAAQTVSKIKDINKTANKPTSKQAEWELKGVGNDGLGKKKGRGKKGRKGAGNKAKNRTITHREKAKVTKCNVCGLDLINQPSLKGNTRIIEDIPSLPIATQVIEVEQEKKYCTHCKKVVTASSELALPKADIGLNTTIISIFMWISSCLPFTKIANSLHTCFGQKISTAGLASHMIMVAEIMKPIYEEILKDVKSSACLHADESGWRVNGKLWWLWVFGSTESAYYTIDNSRGSNIVKKILGEVFSGVLVIDGWRAYLFLICIKQSCMAHLLRKIRKFRDTFPEHESIFKFYIKFRKILRDGETLQLKRKEIGEEVFKRRLGKIHSRLDRLLKWSNPNDILREIIAKVERQNPYILTFIEHEGVPCHNNFAEGLIRKGVLKRKVSFGSKSQKGAEAYAILLSIHTTCKARNIPFEDFMAKSLKQYIRTKKPLTLEEYTLFNQSIVAIAA